jgi:hypothetical protein
VAAQLWRNVTGTSLGIEVIANFPKLTSTHKKEQDFLLRQLRRNPVGAGYLSGRVTARQITSLGGSGRLSNVARQTQFSLKLIF